MDSTNKTIGLLNVVYGDLTMGLKGECDGKHFDYIFNYGRGGLESLTVDGKEWMYRIPQPAFWRALTDNDRGNRFHLRSGMWLAADLYINYKGVKVRMDGREIPLPIAPENNKYSADETAKEAEFEFEFETITVPSTKVAVTYHVKADGSIGVKVHYFGKKGLPELPVFGIRFVMPTAADGFRYEGLSGETYPDRMAGGIEGIYEEKGMPVTPYLVPQDCGMHMESKWLEVFRTKVLDNRIKEGKRTALKFEAGKKNIAFSCLPYTAEELENALHLEELPPVRRTVLCLYAAVRGVGGINSWGAEPEKPYHVSAEEDMELEFRIVP